MASAGVYPFEQIDDTLPYVPLAARRVLDALGRKLSLAGWQSLGLDDRKRLVDAGAGDTVDLDVSHLLERVTPAPSTVPSTLEPSAASPPAELTTALDVSARDVYPVEGMLDLTGLLELSRLPGFTELRDVPYTPVTNPRIHSDGEGRPEDVLTGRASEDDLAPFGGDQAHKAFALAVGLQLLVDALTPDDGFGALLLVARPQSDPVPDFRELADGVRIPGDR